MNRQQKIDFLKRYSLGLGRIEETEPITILVLNELTNQYRNLHNGQVYNTRDVDQLKQLGVVIIVIDEDESQL